LKLEARRRKHETFAAQFGNLSGAGAGACSANPTDVLIWHEIAEQLDDAVLKLPALDRQAVLLRYFEDRPISDIAAALSINEGAARQRLSRAMEKLHQRLSRHNEAMMMSIDASALAGLIASHTVQSAPAGLADAAITAISAKTVSTGLTIAKGAMNMMAWTKAKLAIAATAAIVIGGTGGIVAMRSTTASAAPNPVATQAPAAEEQKTETVSLATAPPVVVKTEPQAGASGVDPSITQIK